MSQKTYPKVIYSEEQLRLLADLIIDAFLATRAVNYAPVSDYDIFNMSSKPLTVFNGRLGQIRKGLSSPGRPLKLYERYHNNKI